MSKEMDQILNDHEKRLSQLEENHEKLSNKLTEVENTVMKGNMATQEMQKEIKEMQKASSEKVDKVFDILVNLIKQDKQDITSIDMAKIGMKTKVIIGVAVALFGTGGILEVIQFIVGLAN